MSEKTSLEQVGGVAEGLSGRIHCYNADAEARLVKVLIEVGQWVQDETGAMLGHIKAAVTLDDGTGITLNLTDMSNGVEKHGNLEPQETVNVTFMCAVLDVDAHELKHRMYHAIDDSGLDYELDEHVECHCHHHHHHDGEECHCHDHDHEHGHEHHHHDDDDDECECHHHHHHDGEECHCHDHDHEHEHHHHHHDDDDDECHCDKCEAKRKEPEKKNIWQKIFGKNAQ